MYKTLFFLKKTDDQEIIKHFHDITLKLLSEIAGTEVKAAKVESNLLLDDKYIMFSEITASSKEAMDKMMYSNPGKALNKDLMNFHQFITVISVNYE